MQSRVGEMRMGRIANAIGNLEQVIVIYREPFYAAHSHDLLIKDSLWLLTTTLDQSWWHSFMPFKSHKIKTEKKFWKRTRDIWNGRGGGWNRLYQRRVFLLTNKNFRLKALLYTTRNLSSVIPRYLLSFACHSLQAKQPQPHTENVSDELSLLCFRAKFNVRLWLWLHTFIVANASSRTQSIAKELWETIVNPRIMMFYCPGYRVVTENLRYKKNYHCTVHVPSLRIYSGR